MELDDNNHNAAKEYYRSAIRMNGSNLWLFLNYYRSCDAMGEHEQALEILLQGLQLYPRHSHLLKLLDEAIHKHWEKHNRRLKVLSNTQQRNQLIDETHQLSQYYQQIYTQAFADVAGASKQSVPTPEKKTYPVNQRKILIIGDYHIPQCIRYRIDQKIEQLNAAGYTVLAMSWTDLQPNEVVLSDIILIYRAPALPQMIKVIAKAKSLNKIIIYEMDDLIFDPIYPADFSEYAGAVSIEDYGNLTHGMALFCEAAKLCDYAIASTNPLKTYLEKLVSSRTAYVHRNGFDSYNEPIIAMQNQAMQNQASAAQIAHADNLQSGDILDDKAQNAKTAKLAEQDPVAADPVHIFYGSGTLAHNTDFIEIALPVNRKNLTKLCARSFYGGGSSHPARTICQAICRANHHV